MQRAHESIPVAMQIIETWREINELRSGWPGSADLQAGEKVTQ